MKAIGAAIFYFPNRVNKGVKHTHTHSLSLSLSLSLSISLRLNCSSTEPSLPQLNLHRNMTDRIVESICSFQPHLRLQVVVCSVRLKFEIRIAIFFSFSNYFSVNEEEEPNTPPRLQLFQDRTDHQFSSGAGICTKEYDRQ